ncbi:hypothetical protein INN71_00135 [Nocardioides sp. ChNu-153]|uniref:hypothetical protein n=1 Tax=unclassified Nocardioides TaxID=2615069 RepID=UPI0024060D80|nr:MULTISPECIES: hypothetical protein [unclassified Nocardioides]MDF9714673.1 hypothetical protein [Nocardioides sp. ChNu-99]MDN7119794.1 hypothetical protein [Nocardioides sp. ChNu-153]
MTATTTAPAVATGRGDLTRVLQVGYLYVALAAVGHAVCVLVHRAEVEELVAALEGGSGWIAWVATPVLPLASRLALAAAAVVVVATVLAVRALPVPVVLTSAALLVPLLGVVPPGPWPPGQWEGTSAATADDWSPYVAPLAADAVAVGVALLLAAVVTVRRRTGERGTTRTTLLTVAALAAITAVPVGMTFLEPLRWLP